MPMMMKKNNIVDITIPLSQEMVKQKMPRSRQTPRRPRGPSSPMTELGARLVESIRAVWGTQTRMCHAIGISEKNLSRIIRQGRIPDGTITRKLMEALPGRMEYVLTGHQPNVVELLTQVPPEVRAVLERIGQLTPQAQAALADVLEVCETQNAEKIMWLHDAARIVLAAMRESQEMRAASPDPLLSPTMEAGA